MSEGEAFILALLLLVGGTLITRKFLSRDARIALGVIAVLAHLA